MTPRSVFALTPLAVALLLALPARAGAYDHPIALEPASVQATAVDTFDVKVTNSNLLGITLTNYGFVGNNFLGKDPSLQYPLGARGVYEHLVRGGLWIGAHAQDAFGEFDGVITGTVDGSVGNASNSNTEFSPLGGYIIQRSTLKNKFFSPSAVSERDWVCSYKDTPARTPAANSERSRPINVQVRQENYSWSFADYTHINIFHFTIRNLGPPLQNVWLGFYGEWASGSRAAYPDNCWPPSSTCSSAGSWFSKKWIAYDDSLRLFREHYCRSLPIPGGCDSSNVPYWIGLRLLGARPLTEDTTTKKITLSAWSYSPGSPARDEDRERYAIMSAGTINSLQGDSLLPATGDPAGVLSIGPFPTVYHDSTISVDFAIVGGQQIPDIQQHSRLAQRAYDLGYIIPVPPESPKLHLVARDGALDMYWNNQSEFSKDPTANTPDSLDFEGYRLYIGENPLELARLRQWDSKQAPGDTTGFNTGFSEAALGADSVKFGSTYYHYKYTIDHLRNGFRYFVAVTAYDRGTPEIESLESGTTQNLTIAVPGPAPGERPGAKVAVFPNPYRVEASWDQGQKIRDHYLWFTNLPSRCTIRIYTLAGDLVYETDFDGATYSGAGARGVFNPRKDIGLSPPTLSGRTFAWNMITREEQAIATGLYMFSIEDQTGGSRQVGKFLVVKSDREEF